MPLFVCLIKCTWHVSNPHLEASSPPYYLLIFLSHWMLAVSERAIRAAQFSPRLGLKSGHTTRVTPTNYCIQGSVGSKVTVEKGKEVGLMPSQALFVMLAVFGREREKMGKPLWIFLWVSQRRWYGLTVHQRQHGAR